MTVVAQMKKFEGDKRSKEYKVLKEEMEATSARLYTFRGKMEWADVQWLFKEHDSMTNRNSPSEPCRCTGVIRQKLSQLKKYYRDAKKRE